MVLHLDEVDVYESIPADSALLSKTGNFSFVLKTRRSQIYQLRLSADKIIVLFPVPGEHIRIQADANNLLPSLTIEGSHGSEQITKLIRMLDDTRISLDSVTVEYKQAQSDSRRIQLNKEYMDILHRTGKIP